MACMVEGIALVCAIVVTLVFRTILTRENKKMDEKDAARGGESGTTPSTSFRYIY